MEAIVGVVAAIPEPLRSILLLCVVAFYFGLPVFNNYKNNKKYWDFRKYQVETLKSLHDLKRSADDEGVNLLSAQLSQELEDAAVRLKPSLEGLLSTKTRLLFGSIGAFSALLIIVLIHYFRGEIDFLTAIGGAVIQAIIPAGLTYFSRAKDYKSAFLFGFGAGFLGHVIITVIYVLSKSS